MRSNKLNVWLNTVISETTAFCEFLFQIMKVVKGFVIGSSMFIYLKGMQKIKRLQTHSIQKITKLKN